MASWNDLLQEVEALPANKRSDWLAANLTKSLANLAHLRDDSNVLFYASAFLQKPQVPPPSIQLTGEELNGFMSVVYGMDFSKPLTLMLHTPGGITNSAETVVAYLRQMFPAVQAVIPTFAMSAGTMIALSADRLIMGKQSQLGPIDPQMPAPGTGRYVSARAIVDQFEVAKTEIIKNPAAAHAWAPVLQSLGPGLLQEARNALDYGEQMVSGWLETYMLAGDAAAAKRAAKHFNDAATHKSHGRRIDRDEARSVGILVDDLEDDQELQEAVLTAYHVMTIAFEKGPATKVLTGHHGRQWVKNHGAADASSQSKQTKPTQPVQQPLNRQQRRSTGTKGKKKGR